MNACQIHKIVNLGEMIGITKSKSCTNSLNKGNLLCKAHAFGRHAGDTWDTKKTEYS